MKHKVSFRFFWSISLLAASSAVPLALADGAFALHSGDVVVFYGDSLTENQLYTNAVETYIVGRYPGVKIRYINAGWTGDTVQGGFGGPIDERLSRDVVSQNPSMVVVMLGMNDVRFGNPSDPTVYTAGMQHIVNYLTANLPGVRITLLGPSPFDEVTRPPAASGAINGYLQQFSGIVAGIAQSAGLLYADANAPLVAALQAANAANPQLAQTIMPDQIHPVNGGALLLAEVVLKAWNSPAVVSRVQIDAGAAAVSDTTNASISGLTIANNGGLSVSWTQLDGSLPMPVDTTDPVTALCMQSSDFLQALNQQTVRITNLPPGNYLLRIDGQTMGTFTADQFAVTVDLAGLQTPMTAQAQQVQNYTLQHNQLHQVRWRQVQIPFVQDNVQSYGPVLSSMDGMESDIVALQAAAAVPVPHQFSVSAQ